jgi:hypothetical protein
MNLPVQPCEFEGIEGQFSGVKVITAFRDGIMQAVEVVSVRDSLNLSLDDPLWHFLTREQFIGRVSMNGIPKTTYLVWLQSFIYFCTGNSSPKLHAFREQLSRIGTRVQQHGSYIDPQAGPAAFIPSGLENDHITQMCAMIISQRQQMEHLGQQVTGIKGEVDTLRNQIGRGATDWSVAVWLAEHGHSASEQFCSQEGRRLRRICDHHNIAVSKEKVCNGLNWPARRWPIEAIKIWWPECCARNNWLLKWKVSMS